MRVQLTNENINGACEEIEQYLRKQKTESKEAIRIRLVMEEALLSYRKAFGEKAEFLLDKGGSLGRTMIRLTIPGASFDPFSDAEFSSDEDAVIRNALTRMGKIPRWRFRRGANEILYTAEKRKVPDWSRLLIAIAAAVFLGLIVRFSSASIQSVLQEGIITPLIHTFMGFLNAVAGPMIFLSVVWGIYSIGDASTFSEIGKRISLRFGLFLILMTTACALPSIPFFSLRFGAAEGGSDFSSLYQMVLDIIPSNLFTPFAKGNTLQILFLACVIGVSMLLMGKNSQSVADLSEQLGYIVNYIMAAVGRLVPYFVFGSLFNIIVSSQLDMLTVGGKFFIGTIAGCAALILLHTLAACLRLRMRPLTLWTKTWSTFLIGLTTASTSAAFSDNLETCVKKLNVSRRIANFGVPFGQILYKPSVSVLLWYAAVSAAENAGLALSPTWIVTALMMCIVLSVAAPPVPGGMSASFAILFTQLGLPLDGLAVILSLSAILDFVVTAVLVFSGQCALAIAARDFKE